MRACDTRVITTEAQRGSAATNRWPSPIWSAAAAAAAFVCHWQQERITTRRRPLSSGTSESLSGFGRKGCGCRRRNAGVSPADSAASRRRRVSVGREVPSQQFGGGKRVAARDAATSAGEDASVPLRHIALACSSNACGIQKRQLRLPHSKPLPRSAIDGESSRAEQNLFVSSTENTEGLRRKTIL